MREIPSNGADRLTIKKFKEGCEIHLAVNNCVTYGYISGVTQLDAATEIEFEADSEGATASSEW